MHIFVTGGTGFFGKALLRHWSNGAPAEMIGARFTLLSRDPAGFCASHGELLSALDARLVAGDIEHPETLPTGDYTHVLHAATDSTKGLSLTPIRRFAQIMEGTRHVLDLALRCGKPRVLLTSSGGVYGSLEQFRNGVPEDYNGMPDPLEPQNAYSIAKRQAEHLCALYHDAYGIDSVIARCFAFVGEDLPLEGHFAIGNFIADALAGRDIVIKGDGSPVRSYLDQRDLASWLTTLLIRGTPQRAYNVGSSEAVSIAELAAKICGLAPGRRPEVRIMNDQPTGQAARRNFYVPDVRRAREELALRATFNLDESIRFVIGRRIKGNARAKC
jgi:UDP-glucuronate decarboxylase